MLATTPYSVDIYPTGTAVMFPAVKGTVVSSDSSIAPFMLMRSICVENGRRKATSSATDSISGPGACALGIRSSSPYVEDLFSYRLSTRFGSMLPYCTYRTYALHG